MMENAPKLHCNPLVFATGVVVITIYLFSYLDMSAQSDREWKKYLLTKGVFGNALRFAHLEKPEEVDRTSR